MEVLYARLGTFGLSAEAYNRYHEITGRHLHPDNITRHDPDLILVTRELGLHATGGCRLPFLDIAQVDDENYQVLSGGGERVISKGADVSVPSY